MASMSSDITWVMEKFFPDTIMSDMRLFILHSINLRPSFAKLINCRTTHNPTQMYVCAGDIINMIPFLVLCMMGCLYMVHVVLQYATDVKNLVIKNLSLEILGGK